MKLSRRICFGLTIATIIILFYDITLPILRQINQTFNLWDWLDSDIFHGSISSFDLEPIVLMIIWFIITIGVTLIMSIFKNRFLHSLIFSLLSIFYFDEFSLSIISLNQISKIIKEMGISPGENLEISYLILVILFVIVFYLFLSIINILNNRSLYSVMFSLFFVFYLKNFLSSIISYKQIIGYIKKYAAVSIGENVDTQSLILVILFTMLFYIFLSIIGFSKKKKEKINLPQKNKPQVEKTPKSQVDFEKERKEKIRDMVLETGKTINEVMQEVHDSTLRDNLQLLHSQVNSISNSYLQSNISFERAVEQLNEIKNDAETLSKEPEETTTGAQVDTETYEENNYYKILKITPDASLEEIKLAYIKKITKYHPDKVSEKSHNDKIKAQKMCQKINIAYHILSHQAKKKDI